MSKISVAEKFTTKQLLQILLVLTFRVEKTVNQIYGLKQKILKILYILQENFVNETYYGEF